MKEPVDVFQIRSYFKILLVIRTLGPIAFMLILLWAISNPYLELTAMGPFILLALAAWAVYEGFKLGKWYNFRIAISDQGLTVRDQLYAWSDFKSAQAQNAFQFQTYIQLTTKTGEVIKIPAVIEQNNFVLSAIEKRLPQLERKI